MPTISIGFNDEIQMPKDIMISMESPINDNEFIWVWDHYFAYVLNVLSENDESEALLETLSQWCQQFATKMAMSHEALLNDGLLSISPSIRVVSEINPCEQLLFVEISGQEGQWPNIHIKIPDDANPANLRDSVIAMGEFFLVNNVHFYRDLPLHMLSMRKFYQDELHYSDDSSTNQAPLYAFDTALKFYENLRQSSE